MCKLEWRQIRVSVLTIHWQCRRQLKTEFQRWCQKQSNSKDVDSIWARPTILYNHESSTMAHFLWFFIWHTWSRWGRSDRRRWKRHMPKCHCLKSSGSFYPVDQFNCVAQKRFIHQKMAHWTLFDHNNCDDITNALSSVRYPTQAVRNVRLVFKHNWHTGHLYLQHCPNSDVFDSDPSIRLHLSILLNADVLRAIEPIWHLQCHQLCVNSHRLPPFGCVLRQ